MTSSSDIHTLVESLKLPDAGNNDIGALDNWRNSASISLGTLQELVKSTQNLPPELIALIIAGVVPLQSGSSWTNAELDEKAENTIRSLTITRDTLRLILSNHVKPFFVPSPHPMLDLNTGRKLPRPAGGTMAMQDYYTTQDWKAQQGLATLLNWVILTFQPEDYESLWPLLIPPVMTYLDDYQAQYKLEGVKLMQSMLKTVPPILLTRSGVGELFYTSLTRSLMALHDPFTPSLIRHAVPTAITLVNLLNPQTSASRFEKLCQVLGDGIIGGVWVYASRELDTVEASMHACEALVRDLGIGSVRYLKGLIPQFVHCLMQHDLEIAAKPATLQLAVLKALETTIEACQPRIERWKGQIIEGVAKAWVVLMDNEILFKGDQRQELKDSMRRLFVTLLRCCPSVTADYEELLRRHQDLFSTLLPDMSVAKTGNGR